MPIYDNDGTTNYEIGKVHDNDGNTNYQIGRVYDNDGTTNYLIYNAEFNAMELTWSWFESGTKGGSFAVNNHNSEKAITLPPDAYGHSHLYFPIDLSQYSKMTITCRYGGAYSIKSFGFSDNTNLGNMNIVELFKAPTDEGTLTEQVYDLSSYNQNGYFKMNFYDGSAVGGWTYFAITKLIFE